MSDSIIDLVSIRQLEPTDIDFILDSAISCLTRYKESIVKGYTPQYARQYIETIIKLGMLSSDHNYSTFVCCHKDDSNHIIAYIIANPRTNHILFQYTKYPYRKLGIQKNILMPIVIDFDSLITVNFPTKEMLKLAEANKIRIENQFMETLIKMGVRNDEDQTLVS